MTETMALARPENGQVNGSDLARREEHRAGVMALAMMPPGEFEQRLAQLKAGQERLQTIHRQLMTQEVDYGVIPGTNKPTLLKPGAEKLCQFYGLVPTFEADIKYGDGETAPDISVTVTCRLRLGDTSGRIVGEGLGACNTWERRYRYRRGERACPSCGTIGTVIKGKAEFGGGWICFAKKGGCGAKFEERDPAITEQVVGDIDNPDPYDLENTVLKMAKKRAHVDAALTVTATSGLYTQDLEDQAHEPAPSARRAEGDRKTNGRPAVERPSPASRGGEPAAAGGTCPECRAPEGRPHGSKCSRRAPQPAEDPGDDGAPMRKLHAVLREHRIDTNNRPLVRAITAQALLEARGEVITFESLKDATPEQLRTAADYISEIGLPEVPDDQPQQHILTGAEVDPFEGDAGATPGAFR